LGHGASFAEIRRAPEEGPDVCAARPSFNVFMEPSTRTRSSFESPEKRLSAEHAQLLAASSRRS